MRAGSKSLFNKWQPGKKKKKKTQKRIEIRKIMYEVTINHFYNIMDH